MLSKEQITSEVQAAKHKLVSSDNYKNLSSWIVVECARGHQYESSIESLRKSHVCPQCSREIVNVQGYPPKKKGHRIVAIDQATHVAGVSVFDDGELVYANTRSFVGTLEERYVDFAIFLTQEVIQNWEVDYLVFEDIQYQHNVQTFKVLGGLLGICILYATANKIPYSVILNKVWQSTFDIKGKDRNTQERNAKAKVYDLFGIDAPIDVADAILLGYHHLLKEGIPLF